MPPGADRAKLNCLLVPSKSCQCDLPRASNRPFQTKRITGEFNAILLIQVLPWARSHLCIYSLSFRHHLLFGPSVSRNDTVLKNIPRGVLRAAPADPDSDSGQYEIHCAFFYPAVIFAPRIVTSPTLAMQWKAQRWYTSNPRST